MAMSNNDHEQRIRCTTCGQEVADMDFLVDHVTDCHDIIDVLVDGITEHYEVVSHG